MNNNGSSNRWFIWALVFIVVIGVGLWAYIQYSLVEMDIESSSSDIVFTVVIHKNSVDNTDVMSKGEAIDIAAASSQCTNAGTISDNIYFNENSKTWWIDLERTPDPSDGCSPACVVSEETKTAEVNWRCTGLLPE